MGLNKTIKEVHNEGVGQADTPKVESGTEAALERLKQLNDGRIEIKGQADTTLSKVQYKPRDFDKEARGKTRCTQFAAALQSNAIAGMSFDTMEQYLKLVKQAADAGLAYSFEE